MPSPPQPEEEARRIGADYGGQLAAALLLASDHGAADRALKRRLAQIVLSQIEAAVRDLRSTGLPDHLLRIYEQAARDGVRDKLLKSLVIGAPLRRPA